MCHNPTNMEMKKPCEKTAPLTVAEAYGTSASTTTTTTTTAPPMTSATTTEAKQMIYEMFKTKKRGMNEEFLRQNGPTCGLNAAAMGLAAEFTLLKARDSDGNQVQIDAIVGKLLDEAKGKNQTLPSTTVCKHFIHFSSVVKITGA